MADLDLDAILAMHRSQPHKVDVPALVEEVRRLRADAARPAVTLWAQADDEAAIKQIATIGHALLRWAIEPKATP